MVLLSKHRKFPVGKPTAKTAKMLSEFNQKMKDEIRGIRKSQPKIKADDPQPTENTRVTVLSVKAPVMNGKAVVGKDVVGNPKAGNKRFSSIVKQSKGNRKSYQQRLREQEELKRVREKSNALKEAHIEELKKERRRIEQRRLQKEENDKKSAVVQRITNTKKLKKLTPKQMRQIIKM